MAALAAKVLVRGRDRFSIFLLVGARSRYWGLLLQHELRAWYGNIGAKGAHTSSGLDATGGRAGD